MGDIVNWIISTSYGYFTDLGSISNKVGNKIASKGYETARKSFFSSLTDYAKQGSGELDDQFEKIKQKPIVEKLDYLYGDKTFSGRYGIDIIKVCVVIFLFMASITYLQIQNNLLQVKRDWPEYRCRPDVMPFAGWINAPEGVSPLEYTTQNFQECSANSVKGAFEQRASMVYVIFNVVMNIFKNILEVIERFRILFDRMRNALKDIFITVFYRIQNIIIPVQNLLIKMVDFFQKIKGILATFLLTMIGILWSFYSLIGSIYELVIIILIVMIIVIIVLWYIPFVGWVLAIAAIAVFLTIAIPLIMLGIVSRQITRQRTSQMPSP
jgi:hypothetical protein